MNIEKDNGQKRNPWGTHDKYYIKSKSCSVDIYIFFC